MLPSKWGVISARPTRVDSRSTSWWQAGMMGKAHLPSMAITPLHQAAPGTLTWNPTSLFPNEPILPKRCAVWWQAGKGRQCVCAGRQRQKGVVVAGKAGRGRGVAGVVVVCSVCAVQGRHAVCGRWWCVCVCAKAGRCAGVQVCRQVRWQAVWQVWCAGGGRQCAGAGRCVAGRQAGGKCMCVQVCRCRKSRQKGGKGGKWGSGEGEVGKCGDRSHPPPSLPNPFLPSLSNPILSVP